MKRTVNLLACLGVFVIGVVLAQANDGTTPAAPAKPCCGDAKPAAAAAKGIATPSTKAAAGARGFGPPYACLQYLLYDDGEISLWSADEYEDLPCQDSPYEIFLWTAANKTAPQSCEAGCEELTFELKMREALPSPALTDVLPKNTKYLSRIRRMPALPRSRPPKVWDPKDGLNDLGELQYDYVAVLGTDDKPIPIKVSAGIADFDRVRFPGFPPTPKTRKRVITIGFEAELPDNVKIETLPVLTAYPWDKHDGVKTTFTVDWEGATYYVTTKQPVKEIKPRTLVK